MNSHQTKKVNYQRALVLQAETAKIDLDQVTRCAVGITRPCLLKAEEEDEPKITKPCFVKAEEEDKPKITKPCFVKAEERTYKMDDLVGKKKILPQ